MTAHSETQREVSDKEEIQLNFDDHRLPELIHAQIGKLNELDAGVKKALDAAKHAEESAEKARKLSADRGLFTDKKKAAIEELQKTGIALAGAVQSGSQAQKLSFEMQKRLAEVAKYLFTLGVSNIAANRAVVRELEMRLRGASEEELSELARQEVMSVIRQLKEQEDLLRKQEQMGKTLSGHDTKISHLLAQTDDLGNDVKNQDEQHHALAKIVGSVERAAEQQQAKIATLQEQTFAQQSRLDALASELAQARVHAEGATAHVRAHSEDLKIRLDGQQDAHAAIIASLERASQSWQQEVSDLRQQMLVQQAEQEKQATALAQASLHAEQTTANLRSALNLRMGLLLICAIAMPAATYFLR